MLSKKQVCAGVVTFNPQEELTVNCVKALIPQVDRIIVFDNGSKNRTCLKIIQALSNNIQIIYNDNNIGIAAALNRLFKIARSEGYKWLLTMDQDSICDKYMVGHLCEYADHDNYGIVAPRVEFWANDLLLTSTKYPEKDIYEIQACITSGSLTRISAWENVRGFDEWMFIDHVDNEFGVHLKDEGYKLLRVNSALMLQKAGEMHYRMTREGKPMMLPYYSPFRQYYICRNSVYYLRKYRNSKNVRLFHEWGVLFYTIFNKLRYETNRWATLTSSIKGIWYGLWKKIEYINYAN